MCTYNIDKDEIQTEFAVYVENKELLSLCKGHVQMSAIQ